MKQQTLQTRVAWSLAEIAEMTGLSLPFIRLQVKNGKLQITRIGRRIIVNLTALNDFLNGKEVNLDEKH